MLMSVAGIVSLEISLCLHACLSLGIVAVSEEVAEDLHTLLSVFWGCWVVFSLGCVITIHFSEGLGIG